MSGLYTILVMFRGGQRQVNLVYQSAEAAENAWDRMVYGDDHSVFEDGYGSRLCICGMATSVEAVLLQDAGRAQEAQIEMVLLQARSQSRANTRAQHDPMIKQQNQIVPGGGFVGRG